MNEYVARIYVLIERDEKLSITQVRSFAREIACWTAYELSEACYATVHSCALTGEAGAKLSSERSEFLGIGTEE